MEEETGLAEEAIGAEEAIEAEVVEDVVGATEAGDEVLEVLVEADVTELLGVLVETGAGAGV